ncbi:WhiB family transcriptional regulator [Streptomyces sp. 049-1]|uniref:WhiB family transcriptional regulator n=1 Tax=Streptomyces sp. 049-1 TaxID=2789264 RepID=UPI00398062FB
MIRCGGLVWWSRRSGGARVRGWRCEVGSAVGGLAGVVAGRGGAGAVVCVCVYVVGDGGACGCWGVGAGAELGFGAGRRVSGVGARPGAVALGIPGFVVAAEGALRCGSDPEAYFSDGVRPAVARRLCAGCEWLAECGAYAVARPALSGVWGGLTRGERAVLRRRAQDGQRGTG